jgi:hypothetical protein
MKKLSFLVIFFFFLSFCKNEITGNYSKLIIGNWTREVDLEIEAPPPGLDTISYTFFKDSAIYHPGIYKYHTKTNEFWLGKYMTNRIKYTITNDVLLLYFPVFFDDSISNSIIQYKIININKDSLKLQRSDSVIIAFSKSR